LSSVFAAIRQIADPAASRTRGQALVADIGDSLDAIRAASVRPRRRVLFIIGRRPGMLADLVAVGPGSYLNDLIGIAGGTNVLDIAGQPEYPRISMEAVLRFDPDVIIDTVDMGDTDLERAQRQPVNERLWKAYPTLTAVKTGRLHAATTDALVVPGPARRRCGEVGRGAAAREPGPMSAGSRSRTSRGTCRAGPFWLTCRWRSPRAKSWP
jgi:iron complex transport system substrate-binding protein